MDIAKNVRPTEWEGTRMVGRVQDYCKNHRHIVVAATAATVALACGFACLPCLPASEGEARSSDDLGRWSLEDYTRRSQKLREAIANVHATFSGLETRSDKATSKRFEGEYYVKADNKQEIYRLCERFDGGSADGETTVMNLTPATVFELRAATADSPYSLAFVNDAPPKEVRRKFKANARVNIDSLIGAAWRVYGSSAAELLEGATGLVSRNVSSGGAPLIEVTFEPSSLYNYKRVRIVFDPSADHAIKEYEAERRTKGPAQLKEGARVEYRRLANGYVVPIKIIQTQENLSKHTKVAKEVAIEYVSFGDVPDAQFTLSAFGIPNITPRAARGLYPFDRWYFWCLVVLGAFGAVYARSRVRAAPHRDAAK